MCSVEPVKHIGMHPFDTDITVAQFSLGGLSPPGCRPVSFPWKQLEMTVKMKTKKFKETDEALQNENIQ